MPSLLPFPPPFRAWLTLSNDPDNTVAAGWQELHSTIWEEFELPFGDSVFLRSVNDSIPDQVTVETHPEIVAAHAVDTLHTWGDYTLSTSEVFHREHAERAVETLHEHGLEPRVWVDHSFFQGNLLHASQLGSRPAIEDASGHGYRNSWYTLDLIESIGVRYVWDSWVRRSFVRPGRPMSASEYYTARTGKPWKGSFLAAVQAIGRPAWRWLESQRFDYEPKRTRLYYPHTFPDGRTLYCFSRYGAWDLADIRGFGELTSASEVDRMLAAGAACIVYTHLGKRHADDVEAPSHIPDATRRSLAALRDRYVAQELMISPTSRLLDYAVLRDHARVEGSHVDFRADGIRWTSLTAADLAGHRFGLLGGRKTDLRVTCEGEGVDVETSTLDGGVAFEVEAGAGA